MVESSHSRLIQLTHLPTLHEIDHAATEATVVKILSKAVALQLKPMRTEISKFAFEYLMLLIDDQLNDMIAQLHRISNIQRRESIAKGDLQLFLEGFNLSPSDLELQCQMSQYYGKKFNQEFNSLHALKEVTSDTIVDDGDDAEAVVNTLVPPTNPLRYLVPKWLPSFPPDHTYKFSPQYNQPITDETVIRKKIVDEGKQSEVALMHLIHNMDASKSPSKVDCVYNEELARDETIAIYGSGQKKRTRTTSTTSDLLAKLPQTNFSIEDYARSRVELARKKVLEYEKKQLELQRNPFIKYSKLVLSTSHDKSNRKQVNKEINTMLKRSLNHLIKSIPELQKTKQEVRKMAEQEREERLEELRTIREQENKDKSYQIENGDINPLDLDEHQDEFFNYSDSDNEEPQLPVESQEADPAPNEHATLPQLEAQAPAWGEQTEVIEQRETPEQTQESGMGLQNEHDVPMGHHDDKDEADETNFLFEDITTSELKEGDEIEI